MEKDTIFWFLIVQTAIELLAISIVGNAIKSILKSDLFKQKLARLHERQRQEESEQKAKTKSTGIPPLSAVVLLVALSVPGWALCVGPEPVKESEGFITISNEMNYALVAINLLLLAIFLYLKGLVKTLLNIDKTPEELKVRKKKESRIAKVLTDRVPLEKEASITMDHEYDGIRELDNNLPPWWKWGFYLSILVAVIYLFNYHVLGIGDLQIEAYKKDILRAEFEVNAYLKDQALNVDENTVVVLTGDADLQAGKGLFDQYCQVCHGGAAEGLVGPNLTDDYWIYGGKINDLFRTIKQGGNNGMKSWKDELSPVQMQQVASFVKSLTGTNPPNAKEPQGEFYAEKDSGNKEAQNDTLK